MIKKTKFQVSFGFGVLDFPDLGFICSDFVSDFERRTSDF
jgi:hypothetical protein